MNTSENINELAAALAAAQGQMTGAVKSASNPHFRSQYSDLASVVDAIREPLSQNGLSYVQGLGQMIDNCLMVTTRLMHTSGQWIESTTSVPVAGKTINAQTLGSAATYGRRYGLQAIVGLPSVDDDGNAASAPRSPQDAAQAILTPQQCAALKALLGELPGETTVNFLRALNVENVESVPANRYDWACQALRKKIQEKASEKSD